MPATTPHTEARARQDRGAAAAAAAPWLAAAVLLLGLSPARGQVVSVAPGAASSPLIAQDAAADAPAEDPAVTLAREQYRAAADALDAAREALEVLVTELADDHAALAGDPSAPTRRNALALAMVDSLPTAKARILSREAQTGRRVARPSRAKILAEVFADPVAAASPVDARLALWVSRRVATSLSVVADLDEVDTDRVLGIVGELFEPGESWYEFWNRAFHEDLPEAEVFSAAHAEVEQAGLALDRALYPERYGPRGQRAPPGMIVVPGGSYELGPNSGNKRPPRKVKLDPFALDVREVTCREYAAFVDAQPSDRRALLPRGWSLDDLGRASYPEDERDHPVAHVDWGQAHAYAVASGKRLPTEDEWEAAAAGFEGRAYPWGDGFLADKANGAWGPGHTLPVESFPDARSAAGCFDMAGNVWEWTSTTADGTDVDALPEGYVSMVIRGGGFDSRRDELACRYRWTALGQGTFGLPTYDTPIGFRCAKDL